MNYGERALVATMLVDNSVAHHFHCNPDDFSDRNLRLAYEGIRDLIAAGQPADILTVSERIQSQTGKNFLSMLGELTANTPCVSSNAMGYFKVFRREAQLRRAREVGSRLTEARELADIETCCAELIAASRDHESSSASHNEAVREVLADIEAMEKGKPPGVRTGITRLDTKLGGFQNSDLIVIAGRSGHGKTAVMMNFANAHDCPVGIISGEQPRKQIAMRSLAITGHIALEDMRQGKMSAEQLSGLDRAIKETHDRKMQIYDGPPNINEIQAVARQWKHEHDIGIIYIDYLQLVTGGEGDAHRVQIGDVARKLKALAKSLDIPIVALAQVARAIDKQSPGPFPFLGRMPRTADLADSAQIEDAADQIITVYRPGAYFKSDEKVQNLAFLNVCKQRHGPTGHISVAWVPQHIQFLNQMPAQQDMAA